MEWQPLSRAWTVQPLHLQILATVQAHQEEHNNPENLQPPGTVQVHQQKKIWVCARSATIELFPLLERFG